MKAIIMAGGLGTRLRPLTCNVPKPMVPILNRPILEHTIGHLKRYGITEIVLLLYYLPDYVINYFGDGSNFGVSIAYVRAGHDYGTAGAVKQAAELIDTRCLVISGDAVTNLDLAGFSEFHRANRALVTLALSEVADPSPFGIAITDNDQRITRFLEKPSWGEIFSDTVNMGIYMLEPRALDFIPEDKEFFFAKDLFPKLLKSNEPLFGFLDDCYWKDIGDLKTYQQVHFDVLEGKALLYSLDLPADRLTEGRDCDIGREVTFEGKVVLGDRCVVADGAHLVNSVLGDECFVGEGARIKNSILWNRVSIGAHSELDRDVIGDDTVVENECFLDENVFISDECQIGSGVRISTNVKIWPNKEVDPGSEVNASLVWGDKWQRELISDARVTGLANFEVSPELGARLGAAFGAWVGKGNSVLVSRDETSAARMIYRSIMCGLMSSGIQVQDLQVAPIPIVRYTLDSSENAGGIHVRRSPFEQKLLDILIFDGNGRDITPGIAKIVERVFYREDFPRVDFDEVGDITYPVRMSNAYTRDFLDHIDVDLIKASKPKIVIDYSHGSAGRVFSSVLGSLDCEVIALNASHDAHKLIHTAMSFKKALQDIAQIVTSARAQIGFFIDAGAEKVYCVDENGEVYSGERLAVLITKLVLDVLRPKKIAVKVSAPAQIENFAKKSNTELVYVSEGSAALIRSTEDCGIEFGLDTTGGFIFPQFHFAFDAMFSSARILELFAKAGTSLSELAGSVPERFWSVSEVPCPWESKGKVMRQLNAYSQDMNRLVLDGVKIYQETGWVLVLPHKEKALYTVMAEGENPDEAERWVGEFRSRVLQWRDSK